jgi:hypothetical protein
MLLFALPFAAPVLAVSLEYRGLDPGFLIPDAIEGFTVEMVSLAGLAVLALHKRRF